MNGLGANITLLEAKFKERFVEYKNFDNLTINNIKNIDEDIVFRFGTGSGLDWYIKALQFLTYPNIHHIYKNVDERIIYLIRMLDPNLILLNDYFVIKQNNHSIDDEDNIKLLKKTSREKFGFYSNFLLNYEMRYFNKFYKENTFSNNNDKDFLDKLLNKLSANTNFNIISYEDELNLNNKVYWYLDIINKEPNIYNTCYHILYQNNLLNLKNYVEQLTFLIMVSDPELKLLQLYYEESKTDDRKEKALNELGFYNDKLILLEKLYKNRFLKDIKISEWII